MRCLTLFVATSVLLLAGCASRLPTPDGAAAPTVIEAAAVPDLLKGLRQDLKAVPAVALGGFNPVVDSGLVLLSLPAASLFEVGNAQLRIVALKPLADAASRVAGRGASVVHVIGLAGNDLERGLAERRAASVHADLVRQGLRAERLRFESRVLPASAGVLLLVIRPVIVGSEALAWVPPELAS